MSAGTPTILTPGDSTVPGTLAPGGQATYQVPSSACEDDRYFHRILGMVGTGRVCLILEHVFAGF